MLQSSKLHSQAWPAINTTNFPSLLMAITKTAVTPGDLSTHYGHIVDPITGLRFNASGSLESAHGLRIVGDYFQYASATTGVLPLASGAMPDVGTKHLLAINVAVAPSAAFGDNSSTVAPYLEVKSSGGYIGTSQTEYVALGAVTGIVGSTVYSLASVVDRDQATDVLACTLRCANASAMLTVGASTDSGAQAIKTLNWGALDSNLLLGIASAGTKHYGLYLLGFDTPGALTPAHLDRALKRMAANPTKGLPWELFGLK